MPDDRVEQLFRAGAKILAASQCDIANELNRQLNQALGWPFEAASGTASDRSGQTTAQLGSLIFTHVQGVDVPQVESINIDSDRLACAIDVVHSLDMEGLRQAYSRISRAKGLKKSPPARDVTHTTTTLGVVFACTATVPIEHLAEELDRLNRQTPSANWPDMVFIGSHGLICYAVQFPGESSVSGQWLPPAEGALANYVPAVYIVMVIRPSGDYTFNQMMHTLVAHLSIFSPGANLPDHGSLVPKAKNVALTQASYQYNLAGELSPVPPDQSDDKIMPTLPFLVQDRKGETLAAIKFLKWQDGGVILLSGRLPIEALTGFLGEIAKRKKTGAIKRGELQLSHVLPVAEQDFLGLIQRFQQYTGMVVRKDPGKFVIQKLADEGTSSPFIARLFLGILKLARTLPDAKKKAFEVSFESLIMALLEIRATAKEIIKLYTEHEKNIATGSAVVILNNTIQIKDSIDRPLRKMVEEFLASATRSFKDRMQRVTNALGVDIGFLYQKPPAFDRGILALMQANPPLGAYIREARRWGDNLVAARNDLDHHGWQLSPIKYTVNGTTVTVQEPILKGQPVSAFVNDMTDHLMCFVEDVVVHCIQQNLPIGLSLTEIPPSRRAAEIPVRFAPTLVSGGLPLWEIAYHASTFDET